MNIFKIIQYIIKKFFIHFSEVIHAQIEQL